MIDFNVSKSRYIRAVQCLKMYWMDRVKPDEYDESVMDENWDFDSGFTRPLNEIYELEKEEKKNSFSEISKQNKEKGEDEQTFKPLS